MSVAYSKAKSVAKVVNTKGPKLQSIVLETMRTIADAVGSTLGPGGRPVLIERQEHTLPPLVTKDGVTVFRALGFLNSTSQAIMETARDASVRTANEAGDGTTTATILAEAIVRYMDEYTRKNPKVSPQKIVRLLESTFRDHVEPTIRAASRKVGLDEEDGHKLLHGVAKLSANGDTALADAVMECYDLVGDEGNVTIAEAPGPSRYHVERLEGYPMQVGYEEIGKFYPEFINDPGNQRCVLEKPYFILYHGKLNDPATINNALMTIGRSAFSETATSRHVVLAATGFSEQVAAFLAMQFKADNALRVFPLVAPQSLFQNGQLEFLRDLQAVTGAEIFDPLNNPLDRDLSELSMESFGPGLEMFEAFRYRSTVTGRADEESLIVRVDELETLLANSESTLDQVNLQERIGKLTGGIARLKIFGASNGEIKEKRDRAEDAVCAVRGAIKHGVLPGGCWTLLCLSRILKGMDPILDAVMIKAFQVPFQRLLENAGYSEDEIERYREQVEASRLPDAQVFDALEGRLVNAVESGILDSTPAVLEAVRNSLSIASQLGALGATIVFPRDLEVERKEAHSMAEFTRQLNADERP